MTRFDAARAKQARLSANVSVEALAAAAGVSPNTVRTAESGKREPRPRVAAALADALGVPRDSLITPDDILTLYTIRRRLGFSQAEMARRIGLGRAMVSRVERGAGGVREPERWARAYQVTIQQWKAAHAAGRERARQQVAIQTRERQGDG